MVSFYIKTLYHIPFMVTFLCRFTAHSYFEIDSARHWSTFVADGTLYAVVATSNIYYSPVLRFDGSTVVEHQRVPLKGVFRVKPVYIGKQIFLVYNSYHGPTSPIFRWDNIKKEFVAHQSVKAYGAGLETFKIGNKVFLAFTGKTMSDKVCLS